MTDTTDLIAPKPQYDPNPVLDTMWARGRFAESVTLPGEQHQLLVELAMTGVRDIYDVHKEGCMCDFCFVARSLAHVVEIAN